MRKQYIKGSDNQLFEILEDDQNHREKAEKKGEKGRFNPSETQLDRLSEKTKKVLTTNK